MAQFSTAVASAVSREAFDGAVIAGDLDTIEAYFAQPHVRSDIIDTEAYVVEVSAASGCDPATFTLRDGSCPWFRRAKKNCNDTDDVPLLCAARKGHVHVIEWSFSDDRAAFMGATLAFLLPLVAKFDGRRQWYQKAWVSDPLVLDALLSSPVFCATMDETKKQTVLDEIAGSCESFQLISVAIAHGASVNEALMSIARYRETYCAAQLQQAGALLVGAELLEPPFVYWQHKRASEYLEHGVDWGSGPAMLLNGASAMAHEDSVNNLLAKGFVDVDARDTFGMTALMQVASVNPHSRLSPHFDDPTPHIARSLLKYCDVNLTDNLGRTALHHAIEANSRVIDVLIDVGIDMTIRDHMGKLAIDIQDDDIFSWRREWPSIIAQFLERGLDPYKIPCVRDADRDSDSDSDSDSANDSNSDSEEEEGEDDAAVSQMNPRCLYDRLLEVEGGPEFIKGKWRYFARDASDPRCISSAGAAWKIEGTALMVESTGGRDP